MRCPRCETDLQSVQAEPRPGAPKLSVETCATCSGLWLDGAKLGLAMPLLGSLPGRMAQVLQTAAPGEFACPRCRGLMLCFDLLGVPIDLCRDCQGVWLDGGEFAELATRQAAPPRPARPALPQDVACAACGTRTPLAETYYSDRGLVCGSCHQTTDSPEAIDGRSGEARTAYAQYSSQQGAIMAANRVPDLSFQSRPQTLQDEVKDLRDEIRRLRWSVGHS